MKNSLRLVKRMTATLAMLFVLFSVASIDLQSQQDPGPSNYCIPSIDDVIVNQQWGYTTACYPEQMIIWGYKGYGYDYFYTCPILEVEVYNPFENNETKLKRISRAAANWGPWEHCYVFTNVRGEVSPGETYNIKTFVDRNYYSYNGTDYCLMYGYYTYWYFRIFIDFNMDGDFVDAGEWVNSPTNVAAGTTKKIGATSDWSFYGGCQLNVPYEYQVSIPDNQKTGTTRMRIMHQGWSYYGMPANNTRGMGGDPCWNGYLYDYTSYYGGWYGMNYGEIEDYLLDFALPFKSSFPDTKAPDDILLAGEKYDGTTRIKSGVPTEFKRPSVTFGSPLASGTILTYQILGPLPNLNVIYTGVDPVTNSSEIRVGSDIIGQNLLYNIQKATGPAATTSPNYGFLWSSGGEYQLVLGLGKDINNMKYMKKVFTVSWEWDLSAVDITLPLSSGPPRFHKYPRGLSLDLRGVVQNVGLRGIAKFNAYFDVYDSKGNLQITKEIKWDTADFGRYVVAAKQKVNLDFGTWRTDVTDIYSAYLRVDLLSATDMEPFNNKFRRPGDPVYQFAVKDEIEAAAKSIDVPAPGSDYIAGRPFIPMGTLSNEGVGDISNAPTRLVIRELPSLTIVYNELVMVEDIPQGRYNLKQVYFPQTAILKPGNYSATMTVSHPDDLESENNTITIFFTVSSGLIGKYTIGSKFLGNTRNFKNIDEAMDMLYLRGMNGSVSFEFTDAEYTVNSRDNNAPAWDLSTAIMGLGYNKATGEYWTLTFKPSEDRLVTRAAVKINLNSTNGKGVMFGQSLASTIPNAIQLENMNNSYYTKFSNNGGYITFDGGANKSFRFVLNSDQDAFGAVFYLGAGSSNINIKNVIMENNKLSIANKVRLPNAHYSIVDGFVFTPNTEITETGWVGYSAGIVNRCELMALSNEIMSIAFDTLPNMNNKFIGNDICGFGYGVVSLGIGPLRVPQLSDFAPFYNDNTLIEGNKIYNVSGAGVVVGNEKSATVKNNVIFDVKGDAGSYAAGIIAGGNASQSKLGYNNYMLNLDGNSISNVRGKDAVYGILVEQDANKFQVGGTEFRVFPPVNDDINVMNNAMWNLRAQNSNTMRAGIHMLTQRDLRIGDPVLRSLTPNYTDYFIRNSVIANNTIMLTEDGITNNANIAGLGIQQVKGLRIQNNAIAVSDGTISAANDVSAGIFYHGDYPANVGLTADKNAFWFGTANVSAYRHIYTDWKTRIIETGSRNEYRSLSQWQMESKSELNSVSTGNFLNDHYFMGTYPEEIRLRSNTKGSILTRRGDRLPEVTHDIYGNIRGAAGGRYDIGAVEFNGALYNHDAEMLVITAPGTYRSTDGMFNDAEYLMTTAPIEIKAIVRNSGNMPVFSKKLYVNVYRELPNGTFGLAFGPVERSVDIDATDYLEVAFNVGDGLGNDFVPQTYNDLRSSGYTVPALFTGMEANVTPRYRIVVSTDPDEVNGNNSTEKISRFYIQRSAVRFLVSNQANFGAAIPTTDDLAYGLNYSTIETGMNKLDWEIDLLKDRYDYDLFNRAGWEPRNVDYSMYRTLLWSDGNDKTLSRLEKLNMTSFIEAGNVVEKKNLIIGSEEMVRNNVNIADADEVFVTDILRGEYRHPGNPLGAGADYSGNTLTGVAVGRDLLFDVMSTGVAGDMYPQPGLMNIVHTGNGISREAFLYNSVQNPEWPDEARIGGIATTTLTSNLVYLGLDWRHFGDIETVLRASFDFIEGSGGTVIPVELLSFDAVAAGKRVDINWTTASELNSARFEVEKSSANSGIFIKIAEMEAAGNSAVLLNYGPVVDNAVEYGNTYIYRLKTYDRNGDYSYSDERTVTLTGLNGSARLEQAYPNPVSLESVMEYYLSESGNIEISLVDASGKVVAGLYSGNQTAGIHNLNINAKNIPSGVYQVVLRSGDIMLTRSINVVK